MFTYVNLSLFDRLACNNVTFLKLISTTKEKMSTCLNYIYISSLDLFEELLVCGADHDGVGVAHHGDQHVQQQDRDQDLKKNEHHFGH